MKIIRSVRQMQKTASLLHKRSRTIGLVPTMGALHEGHLSLIRRSKKENGITVVSIFVNPLQFGPSEDYDSYPRPFSHDVKLCRKEKVDIIFYPRAQEMYPVGFKTYVTVEKLQDVLCGATRTGHFKAVATVVNKLFNITSCDRAYFGQKDGQQAVIINHMAKDLNMSVAVRILPTVRDANGLAMSSRNVYLNRQQRQQALSISRSLALARSLIKSGKRSVDEITRAVRENIEENDLARIEYVSIVDMDDLRPLSTIDKKCMIAVAARFGKTRLIDNIVVRI